MGGTIKNSYTINISITYICKLIIYSRVVTTVNKTFSKHSWESCMIQTILLYTGFYIINLYQGPCLNHAWCWYSNDISWHAWRVQISFTKWGSFKTHHGPIKGFFLQHDFGEKGLFSHLEDKCLTIWHWHVLSKINWNSRVMHTVQYPHSGIQSMCDFISEFCWFLILAKPGFIYSMTWLSVDISTSNLLAKTRNMWTSECCHGKLHSSPLILL